MSNFAVVCVYCVYACVLAREKERERIFSPPLQVKGANEVALEAALIKHAREESTDTLQATITVPGQVYI